MSAVLASSLKTDSKNVWESSLCTVYKTEQKKSNFILHKVICHLQFFSQIKNNQHHSVQKQGEQMAIGFISPIFISSRNLLRKIKRPASVPQTQTSEFPVRKKHKKD
jgi:hypothetical protein